MGDARETALSIIHEVLEGGAYSNIALDGAFAAAKLDRRDRGFAAALSYGVISQKLFLDFQIKSFSNIGLKKISPRILNILRMGMYQILFMDRVPASAAVNESVRLARRYGHGGAAGFVNAVLRNMLRLGAKPAPDWAIRYSCPDWIIDLWKKERGSAGCEALLKAQLEPPEIHLRVNTLRAGKEELMAALGAKSGAAPDSMVIAGGGAVSDLPGFRDGLFTVQDGAAQMAAIALGAKPGERVLDMCAAPGGKTTYIAQIMGDKGEITAWDIFPHKIRLIESAAKRLGIGSIKCEARDAKVIDESLFSRFDRVLCDVPCSGLGLIRRRPEIKWRREPGDIAELCKLQAEILSAGAKYLKPGGALVYCTCTISAAENEMTVQSFLDENHDFTRKEERTLLPHIDDTDGFYICALKKGGQSA